MKHTPTVNFSDFEDDGISQAVYFILDQSRDLPVVRRANIMLQAAGLFPNTTERSRLCNIAQALIDCDKVLQEMLEMIRFCNPDTNTNEALSFMMSRIEVADLKTKLEFVSNTSNMGLEPRGKEFRASLWRMWTAAEVQANGFYHEFETFMFRLRNRLWKTDASAAAAQPAA